MTFIRWLSGKLWYLKHKDFSGQSQGFQILQDFTIICLIGYLNGNQVATSQYLLSLGFFFNIQHFLHSQDSVNEYATLVAMYGIIRLVPTHPFQITATVLKAHHWIKYTAT